MGFEFVLRLFSFPFLFFLARQSGVKARAHQVFIAIAHVRSQLETRIDDPHSAYFYTTGCGIRPVPNRNLIIKIPG